MSSSLETKAAVSVRNLSKAFGAIQAVRDLSFDVAPGESLALIGPNGSGKTTLLRILAALLPSDSGSASITGFDVTRDSRSVRKAIGYVPQNATADPELTAAENLRFFCSLHGVPSHRQRVEELLDLAGLTQRADDQVNRFSGGMRRRLELVRALVSEPQVLLLDEPTAGLDAQSREEVWAALETLRSRRDAAIVLATHQQAEEAALCGRSLRLNAPSESVA